MNTKVTKQSLPNNTKIMMNIKHCLVYNKLGAQLFILHLFKVSSGLFIPSCFPSSQFFFYLKLYSKTENHPVLHLTWKQYYLIYSPCETTSCIDCRNNLSMHRLFHIFPSPNKFGTLDYHWQGKHQNKIQFGRIYSSYFFFQYNLLYSHHYLHNIRPSST